jgi:hypothetical protein
MNLLILFGSVLAQISEEFEFVSSELLSSTFEITSTITMSFIETSTSTFLSPSPTETSISLTKPVAQPSSRPPNPVLEEFTFSNSVNPIDVKKEAPVQKNVAQAPAPTQVPPTVGNEIAVNSFAAPPTDIPSAPNTDVQQAGTEAQIQSTSTGNNNALWIAGSAIGVGLLVIGGFVAGRKVLFPLSSKNRDVEETSSTPRDLSLERLSNLPTLHPIRLSALPIRNQKENPSSKEAFIDTRESLYSNIVSPRHVASAPILGRESLAFSDLTVLSVEQRDSFLDDEVGFKRLSFEKSLFKDSSLISMMNSQDEAAAVVAAAASHAASLEPSHSQSDKYDSMLFSDDGSDYEY